MEMKVIQKRMQKTEMLSDYEKYFHTNFTMQQRPSKAKHSANI